MANHKSAIKEHRQALARRERNRNNRSRLRTAVKKVRKAIADGDSATATGLLPATLALVDHSAKLGALHDNSAARTKSRLTRAVNKLTAAS